MTVLMFLKDTVPQIVAEVCQWFETRTRASHQVSACICECVGDFGGWRRRGEEEAGGAKHPQ